MKQLGIRARAWLKWREWIVAEQPLNLKSSALGLICLGKTTPVAAIGFLAERSDTFDLGI